MMNELDQLIRQLAVARQHAQEYRDEANAMLEVIKESFEYNQAIGKAKGWDSTVSEWEAKIRALGGEMYEATKNKKLHEFVSVKIFPTGRIDDPDAARAWCFTGFPDGLEMSKTKVIEYAKKFGGVPGVTVYDDPRVQIATKLTVEQEGEA